MALTLGRVTGSAGRGPRLFVAPVDEPRSQRASDVILLVAATAGLALLSLVAVPQAGFERALIAFLASIPRGLDGLWQLVIDLFGVLALVIVVATAVRRRWSLLRDLVVAVVVALLGAVVVARVVQGSWPSIWDPLRTAGPPPIFPALRLALPGAVVMTASPHLNLSIRRLGRWSVVLAAAAAAILGTTTPSGAVAGVLVAAISAAVVHLVFGSIRGRPSIPQVAAALAEVGVTTASLDAPDRQPAGFFLVRGEDDRGGALVVKVYGRDAHDTQLLTTLWRTVWYREAGAPVSAGRLQQAEHEAFLTLLAGQTGVLTQRVVTAAATAEDDVLLVLRPVGRTLADEPDRWSDATVRRMWAVLRRLHDAGIAHGQVDDRHLVVEGDEVGLIDFRGGTVAAPIERRRTDEAQALLTTTLAVGEEPAIEAAIEALGPDSVAAGLPYLQDSALTADQHRAIRLADLDLDDLRSAAARSAGVEPPALQRLRRVTWGSVLQVGLLAFAFLAITSAFAGLDWEQFVDDVADATWWLVAVGFVVAQLPRFSQAVSALGASPIAVPLGPLYGLQLATSYIGIAVPTSAARIAVNVRFFQRHGLPPGTAVAVGAIDGFSGFIVQAFLLVGLLLFTPASLELNLDGGVSSGLVRLVLVILAVAVMALAVVLLVPQWRRPIVARVVEVVRDARGALRGLRSLRRLGLLIGGNLASELLFALALGAFARSLGFDLGLAELVFINITVSLLAGLLPVPGGIGVVEGGLTLGLARAGMPEEAAFAAALLYRLATFYLPPIWGFFAFKWLERTKHL